MSFADVVQQRSPNQLTRVANPARSFVPMPSIDARLSLKHLELRGEMFAYPGELRLTEVPGE
jgi:hypothetical protein